MCVGSYQVSSLFKDGTIGTDINIVLVSLLLLEEEPVRWSSFESDVCDDAVTDRSFTRCVRTEEGLHVEMSLKLQSAEI